jgi:hypothetical protein
MHSDPSTSAPHGAGYEEDTQSSDVHAYHDPSSSATLSATLSHTLADVMGTDVTDVERALSERVDPDALDSLFAEGAAEGPHPAGHLAFTVMGYRVTVYSGGDIVVTPPQTGQ